jgi:hypothetical protein
MTKTVKRWGRVCFFKALKGCDKNNSGIRFRIIIHMPYIPGCKKSCINIWASEETGIILHLHM